jgi:two-component system sensor histidine kinase TctE
VTVIDPSYRVTLFNQRAGEIVGRIVETGTPMNTWDVRLFHLDGTAMAFDERVSVRALAGETVRDFTYEMREPERDPYVVRASSAPIRDASGEVVRAVSIFEDVTEEIRRAEADTNFVANAAHQIRGPIAAIASASAALTAGAKEDPTARDRFLEHIAREVARMEQLAAGLLTLARAERGEFQPPLSLIALRPLLQRVIDRSSPKDGVDLELTCPAHLTAYTNEALVSEAVASVVMNAVQHTNRGTVRLRGRERSDGASIEICDEGPGIPAVDRERVFERFFRGSVPAGTGVGLGLAIAATATSAAGGVLELVESPVGACFRFSFRGFLG